VTWNDERGFGFIHPESGGKDLFFHVSAVERAGMRPREHMRVSYRPATDAQGRRCAVQVHPRGLLLSADAWPLAIALPFLLALAYLAARGVVPAAVPMVYTAMSLVTLLVYRWDKQQAVGGGQRTPERLLHMLELLGGWPGALVAQQRYRHKSIKLAYQIAFWVMVTANLAMLSILVWAEWA